MTIKIKPQKLAEFIAKAPDAAAAKPVGEQVQITVKMTTELLASVDAAAKALNISRAGYIKMSLSNALKG